MNIKEIKVYNFAFKVGDANYNFSIESENEIEAKNKLSDHLEKMLEEINK